MKVFQSLASKLVAFTNCIASGNSEWQDRHAERIELIMADAPSGSGIDNGTRFLIDESNADKLVFLTAFHHMNEGGFYDGWTEHKITIRPSFNGFTMKISGRDRNMIKDYLADIYHTWLNEEERKFDI